MLSCPSNSALDHRRADRIAHRAGVRARGGVSPGPVQEPQGARPLLDHSLEHRTCRAGRYPHAHGLGRAAGNDHSRQRHHQGERRALVSNRRSREIGDRSGRCARRGVSTGAHGPAQHHRPARFGRGAAGARQDQYAAAREHRGFHHRLGTRSAALRDEGCRAPRSHAAGDGDAGGGHPREARASSRRRPSSKPR